MKRNVLKTIALTVCLIMAAAFGVACGGNGTGANNSSNGGNGGASTPNMETCAHSFTNYQSNGDATCTANGTKTAVCDNGCGAEDTVTDTGSMLQHSFENGVCGGCGEKEYTEGLQFALASNKKGYAVTGYTGTDKEVYIPSTYDGMPVTEIGEWAFYDNKDLTKVVIREGVGRVLKGAFGSCKQLKSISIPSTVFAFFDNAFVYCYELKEVHITDLAAWCQVYAQSNTYANPLSMGHNLYLNGELVTELTIPEEASYVGSCAFQNCLSLTKVVIPNHVSSIDAFAFYTCTNLQSVILEGGGEHLTIGDYAFGSCYGLTSIIIPAEVWGIEQATFNNCTNLTIYCEAESKPSTWNWVWEITGMPVYWYSENEPQHNSEGTGYWLGLKHWRYDEQGGIYVWVFGEQYNPAQ